MKKKNLLFVALLASLLIAVPSCGESPVSPDTDPSSSDVEQSDEKSSDTQSSNQSDVVQETDRKIVYTCFYYVHIDNLNEAVSKTKAKVIEFNGYTESMNQDSEDSSRYVFRIPTKSLDSFIDWIDGNFEVESKNVSSRDITSSYNQIEARIQILEASRASYVKMLAENSLKLADIIAIQERIENIDSELLYLNNQKSSYDSRLNYSYVTINFSSYKYEEPHWYDSYFENIGNIFEGLFIAFMYTLPFGLLGGVVAGAIIIPIQIKKKKTTQTKK